MYAGKYYAIMSGDPFLGKLLKGVGKVVGAVSKVPGISTVVRALPGIGTVATLAGPALGLAKKAAGALSAGKQAYTGTRALVPYAGGAVPTLGRGAALGRGLALGGAAAAGAGAAALLGGGAPRRRYRRMNALNPKAAARAIRRIKAVRKVCRSIESQLPKRAAAKCAPFRRKRAA